MTLFFVVSTVDTLGNFIEAYKCLKMENSDSDPDYENDRRNYDTINGDVVQSISKVSYHPLFAV